MANYNKLTDFASKDTLPQGNAAKIVKGTEIDDEFSAVETAIATKADTDSVTFTGTSTVPTAALGTSNTQIANTAFVQNAISTAYGAWTVVDSGTTLHIAYNGTNLFALTSAGNLTVIGDVTAFGTV